MTTALETDGPPTDHNTCPGCGREHGGGPCPPSSLRERAAAAAKAADEARLEYRRGEEERQDIAVATALVHELRRLGIVPEPPPATDVRFQDPSARGPHRGAFLPIQSGDETITFGMVKHYGDLILVVLRTCVRCEGPIWARADGLVGLHEALTTEHDHRDCLIQYDDEGEPTTDRDGNPLPPRAEREPEVLVKEPTAAQELESLIRAIARDEIVAERELR